MRNSCNNNVKVFVSLALSFAAIFSACRKDLSLAEEKTLSGQPPEIFGHGGMGTAYRYPMNSLRSLTDAVKSPADGVEMDVHLTRDSVVVFFHPYELNELTKCRGRVFEHTLEEIKTCRYKPTAFSVSDEICTANEFFDAINPQVKNYIFECKVEGLDDPAYARMMARRLAEIIRERGVAHRSFVESYNAVLLEEMHRLEPSVGIFAYSAEMDTSGNYHGTPIQGITIDLNKIDAADVRAAHRNKLEVSVFNARTRKQNVRALQIGADIIQTDRVKHLAKVLKK